MYIIEIKAAAGWIAAALYPTHRKAVAEFDRRRRRSPHVPVRLREEGGSILRIWDGKRLFFNEA